MSTRLNSHNIHIPVIKPRELMLIIDTMYFKRMFGVMVFRDWYQKENVLLKFVNYETIAMYQSGVKELQDRGFSINGIVADGRRGIFRAFGDIPVQMCHFHQKKIVQRHISLNPKLEAGIELKEIVNRIAITDKESFEYWLDKWHIKWSVFLSERTTKEGTSSWQYTHRGLRSAYYSLRTNLDNLYTYLDPNLYPTMPNTTNSLDGSFAHVKDKVRLHRGLRIDRKKKLIQELLLNNVT